MVALDVLLAEAPQDPPCGPNLEYDPGFAELDKALLGTPERWDGTKTIPARDPEWPAVRQLAEDLLLRTKDLRVAVQLNRALVKTQGFAGLATGLALVAGLLTRYWDSLHPGADPTDPDPGIRINALAPLSDTDTLVRDIRNLTLVDMGVRGRLLVRDVLAALGKLPAAAGATVTDLSEVREIARSLPSKTPDLAAAVLQARDSLKTIAALLHDKADSLPIPDLRPLQEAIDCSARLCEPEPEAAVASAGADTPAAGEALGGIRNRDDAVRHLERVCEFLQRTEPANPAPLLIRRAVRLMTKNFVEIIEDLAPESLGEIQKLAGLDNKQA